MIVTVTDVNGETYEFGSEKFVTDEHNNLEVHGRNAAVFNRTFWAKVEVDVED